MERGFISRCVSLWVRGCCPAAPTHTLSLPSCFSDLCQAEVPVLEGDLQPLTTTSNSSGYSSAVLDSTSRRHVAPVSGYTGVGGGVPVQVCRGMREVHHCMTAGPTLSLAMVSSDHQDSGGRPRPVEYTLGWAANSSISSLHSAEPRGQEKARAGKSPRECAQPRPAAAQTKAAAEVPTARGSAPAASAFS
jgi:hypothetical protein